MDAIQLMRFAARFDACFEDSKATITPPVTPTGSDELFSFQSKEDVDTPQDHSGTPGGDVYLDMSVNWVDTM